MSEENQNQSTNLKLNVFKEIQFGGISKTELFSRLGQAGIQFNKYAEVLFHHPDFQLPPSQQHCNLIKLSLSDLDLNESCTSKDFEGRAVQLGLELCPLALAAFLRLQYLDQPEGPYLTIASKIRSNSGSDPKGFYIRKYENKLWLRGYVADGFAGWPSPNDFIFIKSDQTKS